jgi:hypothetical protein
VALAIGLVVGLIIGFFVYRAADPSPSRTSSPPTTTTTTRPAPSTSTTTPSGPLKPLVSGLIDRNGVPPAVYLGVVKAFVVSVYWSDLEPDPDGPLAPDNAIDQAIATTRTLNASHPGLDMSLKLRVYGGIYAPAWAKSLGGAPISVENSQSGTSGTVGPFWTPQFGAAWDGFQAKLSAAYSSVPEIREVVIGGRCSTVFDEPFERNRASLSAFEADGYTMAADEQCLEQEIENAASLWPGTRIGMAFNPFQVMTGKPGTVDEAFTEQMMELCRSRLGPRCVLENDSIRYPPQGGAYGQMYATMTSLGPPIAYQTATMAKIGNLIETLQWATQQGASSVELPDGYANTVTPADLQTPSNALETEAAKGRNS